MDTTNPVNGSPFTPNSDGEEGRGNAAATVQPRMGQMIDFDVMCRKCGKPMTLRVRDEEARVLCEQHGVLCERCHEPGFRPAPARRTA